jgi:hypothetical protein
MYKTIDLNILKIKKSNIIFLEIFIKKFYVMTRIAGLLIISKKLENNMKLKYEF